MSEPFPTIHQRLSVPFDYPVVFTRNLFEPANRSLVDALTRTDAPESPRRHRCVAYLDAGAVEGHPELPGALRAYAQVHRDRIDLVADSIVVPGGEQVKNDYRGLMNIFDTLMAFRLCRQSFVLVLGGGAVLDAVGFGVSLLHRGLRLVRIPSTVLAQNDVGVGVKNGMNLHGGKNTIGTFHPPWAVLNDFALLSSLDDTAWRDGVAEAFKVATIRDTAFFAWLCEHAAALRRRDPHAMECLVHRCAALHLQHLAEGGDPFETGSARPLDFGHWSAHRLEAMSNYQISHGHAVAVGVALDAAYAERMGSLPAGDLQRLLRALTDCGFPLWYDVMGRRDGHGRLELLQGLEEFREHLGGALCITLPDGLGRKQEVDTIDHATMEACILAQHRTQGARIA